MTRATRSFAWSLGVTVALAGTYLLVLSLLPVDETRYAGVALEMWQNGDFLVPRINGELYPHKPPLLFWIMQAGWALFGVNDWWPRIAVSVFSVLSLGLTWRLARVLFPESKRTAAMAPVIVLGSLLWAVWTPAVMFDVVLAFWVLLGVLGVADAALKPGPAGWLLVALGMGLGTLTKGPVALLHVLPVAVLAPFWHPRSPPWRRWYTALALSVLGAAVVALAWAAPAALRGGPVYASAIFWGQSAGRMVDSFAHQQPIWWYLPVLPLALFPWLWWGRIWKALAGLPRDADWSVRFLLAWTLPVSLAFTFISGKQIHYLVPLVPGAALLFAKVLENEGWTRPSPWWDGAPTAAVLLLLAALTAWAPEQQAIRGWPAWVAEVPLWLPVVLGVLGILSLAPQRRLTGRVFSLATISVAVVLAGMLGIARTARPWYDLSGAAQVVAQAQAAGHPVAHLGKYHNRLRFLGRLRRPVTVVTGDTAEAWKCEHPDGLVVTYDEKPPPAETLAKAVYTQPFRSNYLLIRRASDLASGGCSRHSTGVLVGGES